MRVQHFPHSIQYQKEGNVNEYLGHYVDKLINQLKFTILLATVKQANIRKI